MPIRSKVTTPEGTPVLFQEAGPYETAYIWDYNPKLGTRLIGLECQGHDWDGVYHIVNDPEVIKLAQAADADIDVFTDQTAQFRFPPGTIIEQVFTTADGTMHKLFAMHVLGPDKSLN